MKSLACVLLVGLAACDLYFSDDDDCLVPALDFVEPSFRNPHTGLCEGFGAPCDPACGSCPDIAFSQPIPDWGSCFSACEGLTETACIDTAGCRAVYDANSEVDVPPLFFACWEVAPSGPVPGGCTGLDAYECSRHDNCAAYYDAVDESPYAPLTFRSCRAEPVQGCYGDQDCGEGAHCSTSEGECLPPPGCGDGGCPAVCYGRCVSDADICAAALCEGGTHCEAECTEDGCHPVCVPDVDACAAVDCAPGFTCVQTCDPSSPTCQATCVPAGTCESLPDEPTCAGRPDCRRVYTGDDCTCYSNGTCECQVLTYERCETK